MEFTVRELDPLELPIEMSEDPDELVFVLEHAPAKTLVCPTAFDSAPDGGGWRALLIGANPELGISATVKGILATADLLPSDCFVVSTWKQSYLVIRNSSLAEARRGLEASGYPVFAPLGDRPDESAGFY